MVKSERIYERLGSRYSHWLPVFGAACTLLVLGVVLVTYLSRPRERRLTLVIAANPVTVVVFDSGRHKLVTLSFPPSSYITGVHGAGQYSLEALWRLGNIDKSERLLLPQSLEETAGLPVSSYLGYKSDSLPAFKDSSSELGQIFSLTQIIPFMTGRFRTNLSLPSFISLSLALPSLRPEDVSLLRVMPANVLVETALPDGTKIEVVDPDRLDSLIGTAFEDEVIRLEGVRVTVLNTTGTAELGSRVERLLSHIGTLVVAVGNDKPEVDKCVVTGQKKFLGGATAQFIGSQYQCEMKESDQPSQADLVLRLGKDYRQRFLPQANQ